MATYPEWWKQERFGARQKSSVSPAIIETNYLPIGITRQILNGDRKAKGYIVELEAIEWEWLRELIRPRVEAVGFGPW